MFQDVIGIATRTWPYGTRKTVLIVECQRTAKGVDVTLVMEELETGNEGHILIGGLHAIEPAKGRKAIMQFMRGGPTGGYWSLISFVE